MTRYHPSFSDPATSHLLLALYTDALAQALTR
jgi:hypothetical protein